MSRFHLVIFVCLLCVAGRALPSESSPDEQTLWDLEHAYWHYVETHDLAAYSNLWHKDFLGWPAVSSAPVRKDHITDWITSQTSKGLAFKTGDFKPAALQVTGLHSDGWARMVLRHRVQCASRTRGSGAERTGRL